MAKRVCIKHKTHGNSRSFKRCNGYCTRRKWRRLPFTNSLMEKGSQDGVANTSANLEIGDLVQGFKDANTVWKSAIYNGGDPTDRENYTPLIEVVLQEPVHYSGEHYSSEHYSTN